MLALTDSQVELLIAMRPPITVQVNTHNRRVLINRQSFKLADLYALRAAKLARPAKLRHGTQRAYSFELTDLGIEEAQRRSERPVG